MNIYRISQTENSGYDTYDSAIVLAETEDEARNIHPGGSDFVIHGTWASHPEQVAVEYLGVADTSKIDSKHGRVLCASFNAG